MKGNCIPGQYSFCWPVSTHVSEHSNLILLTCCYSTYHMFFLALYFSFSLKTLLMKRINYVNVETSFSHLLTLKHFFSIYKTQGFEVYNLFYTHQHEVSSNEVICFSFWEKSYTLLTKKKEFAMLWTPQLFLSKCQNT